MVAPASEPGASAARILDDLGAVARWHVRNVLPWTNEALLRLLGGNAVGIVLVLLSWYESSGATSTSSAVTWFKVGIGGVVVAGVSNGLWLLRGRQTVGLARVALLDRYARRPDVRAAHAPSPATTALVVLPTSHRYHRAGCPMVRGKAVAVMPFEVEQSDRVPCQVCRP